MIRFRLGLIVGVLLALAGTRCEAHLVQGRDPLWLGDSTLAVIVRPVSKEIFAVEDVELDENSPPILVGNVLEMPKFQLLTYSEDGPDKVDTITPDTRILLFLKRDAKTGNWVIGQDRYAFFWVQKPQEIEQLQKQAREAIAMRSEWRAARDTPEVGARVRAIYPFLEKYNQRFNGVAQIALQKTGVAGGDFLSGKLETMSQNVLDTMLFHLAPYQSEKLHRTLLQFLSVRQKRYEGFLAHSPPGEARRVVDDWDNTPDSTQDLYGNLYYGLAGLVDFKDRHDLPVIRRMALWSLKYHFEQVGEAALDGFQAMPERANLPIIAAMWKIYAADSKERQFKGLNITGSLFYHHFPETVALLAPMLRDKDGDIANEAHNALVEIVGRDLGKMPEAWLKRPKVSVTR